MFIKRLSTLAPMLLLSSLMFLTACDAASNAAPQAAAKPASEVVVEAALDEPGTESTHQTSNGPLAPDWELPTLDGGSFKLVDHQGEVVVMFFMATWCSSCILEARALAELHDRYAAEGLTIVAINAEPGQKVKELKQFQQWANNGQYTWAFDDEFKVVQAYKVQALDTTFIIDRSGRIAYSDASPTPLKFLEEEILKWL